MKRELMAWFLGTGLLIGVVVGIVKGQQTPRPRFELMLDEVTNWGIEHRQWSVDNIQVIHDKETGDEIVCVFAHAFSAMSCYKTGRSWK